MKWIGLKEIKIDREVVLKNLPRIEGAQISSLGDYLSVFFKISYHSDLNVQFVCKNSPLSSALKNISFSGLFQIRFKKQVPITDIQVNPSIREGFNSKTSTKVHKDQNRVSLGPDFLPMFSSEP